MLKALLYASEIEGGKRTNYLTSKTCILDGWTRNKETDKYLHDMLSVNDLCCVNVMES